MEVYKTLKRSIRYADIGLIRRMFARCALIFHGSNKQKYAHLSLYMSWLTQTAAAQSELQDAILANGLVNLRGAQNSWFKIDRLNELFNLQMKLLMATRRTSSLSVTEIFQQAALTASYCTDLTVAMEHTFGRHVNTHYTDKDASEDVRNLAYKIAKSQSIHKYARGRDSEFHPPDVLGRGVRSVVNGVKQFNKQVVEEEWTGEEDAYEITTTSLTEIEELTTHESFLTDVYVSFFRDVLKPIY